MRREVEQVLFLLARRAAASRNPRHRRSHGRSSRPSRPRTRPRAARAPPRRHRAAAGPASASTSLSRVPSALKNRTRVTRRAAPALAPRRRSAGRRRPVLLPWCSGRSRGGSTSAPRDSRARARAAHGSAAPTRWRRPTAEREGDVAQVGNQPRRIDALAADVEVAVIAMCRAAVDRSSPGPARAQPRPTASRHGRSRASRVPPRACAAAPKPTHSAGDSVPERKPRSCPPPWMQRRRLAALAHPQGANALGAVDLVRRDGDQVRPFGDVACGRSA